LISKTFKIGTAPRISKSLNILRGVMIWSYSPTSKDYYTKL